MILRKEQKDILLQMCKSGIAGAKDIASLWDGGNLSSCPMYLTYERLGDSVVWEEHSLESRDYSEEKPILLTKEDKIEILRACSCSYLDEEGELFRKLSLPDEACICVLRAEGDSKAPDVPERYRKTKGGGHRLCIVVGRLEEIQQLNDDIHF